MLCALQGGGEGGMRALLFGFVSTQEAGITWEEAPSAESMLPSDWMLASLWAPFLD